MYKINELMNGVLDGLKPQCAQSPLAREHGIDIEGRAA